MLLFVNQVQKNTPDKNPECFGVKYILFYNAVSFPLPGSALTSTGRLFNRRLLRGRCRLRGRLDRGRSGDGIRGLFLNGRCRSAFTRFGDDRCC